MTTASSHPVERGLVSERPRTQFSGQSTGILGVVGVCVSLYLAFGKGFAYAGVPPVFLGEVLLALLIITTLRPTMSVPRNEAALVAFLLLALGSAQVIDDIVGSVAPILETLRGFAVVYYSIFAFSLYALLCSRDSSSSRQDTIDLISRWRQRAAPWILTSVFFLALLLAIRPKSVPTWPTSGVPIFFTKSTDISVALAALLPIVFAWAPQRRLLSPRRVLVVLWVLTAILITVRSRGALIALAGGWFVTTSRKSVRATKLVIVAAATLALLNITNFSVRIENRDLSFRSVVESISSLMPGGGGDRPSNYVDTRNWRTNWWGAIWSDVKDQAMIVHGNGWGDNLAVRHGIVSADQADDPLVLRLPHNVFFSLAGRAGVLIAIGLVLVIVLTVTRTGRRRIGPYSDDLTVKAARGALVAALLVAMTDIYLESPQGAIVVWSICGFLWWVMSFSPPPGPHVGRRSTP